MINGFSSNMNTLNLYLKIKPGPFYKIMNGFIIKINNLEILKLVCHVLFPLC